MSFFNLLKTLKALNKNQELKGKKIVFTPFRILPLVIHLEMFMANIYARKGASVFVIIDDGVFEHWDTLHLRDKVKETNPYRNRFLNFDYFKSYVKCKILFALYSHKNIKIIKTSSIIKNRKLLAQVKLPETEKADAVSSVRRYVECGYYDSKDEAHKNYYKKCEINCIISHLVGKYIVNIIKADKYITSHGIYSLWGPVFSYVKSQKVDSFVYGTHVYKEDEVLFMGTIAQTLSLDKEWVQFDKKNHKLTEDQYQKINNYFEIRINHKAKDTSIYYGEIKKFETLNFGEKNENIKNYCLFPNIIWDGDVSQRDKYFNGILDWVIKTVQVFEKNDNNNLIIRFHPAETTLYTKIIKLKEVLINVYPNIESIKNVFFVDSHVKIDTYKFIKENVDVGLVYDGMICLEMLYLDVPVISPSVNRYNGGSTLINPETAADYNDYLINYKRVEEFKELDKDKKRNQFFKYAYWYLFKAGYFMPIFDPKKYGKISYSNQTIEGVKSQRFKRFEDKLSTFE